MTLKKEYCEDCGKQTENLINNEHYEHGDFFQCSECYGAFLESFEAVKSSVVVNDNSFPSIKKAILLHLLNKVRELKPTFAVYGEPFKYTIEEIVQDAEALKLL